MILVNFLFVGVTLFSAAKGGLIGANTIGFNFAGLSSASVAGLVTVNASQQKNFQILTYILAACAGLLFLLTLLMISRLKIAIACLKVASVAIDHMPMLLFFPLFTLAIFAFVIVWWVAVTVFLYACGTVAQDPITAQWEVTWTRNLQYVGIYHLFGLLWTIQFLVAFSQVVVAGAVGTFYWCRADANNEEMRKPISSAQPSLSSPPTCQRHCYSHRPQLRSSGCVTLTLLCCCHRCPTSPPTHTRPALHPQPRSTALGGTTWAPSPSAPSSSQWCSSSAW